MLMVLIVAVILCIGCVFLAFIVPHPITWLMAIVLALLIGLILWPKYQAQKQALEQGQVVLAQVTEVRQWARKEGDGNEKIQYQVVATWMHPQTHQRHEFIADPQTQQPVVNVGDQVGVKVVFDNPKAYRFE